MSSGFHHRGIEFVRVKAGRLLMGLSDEEEAEARRIANKPRIWWESVRPPRLVEVRSFAISAAPISQLDAATLDPRLPQPDHTQAAMPFRTTWKDATNLATSLGGRLPTEPEWEYACRGGSQGLFAFGSLPDNDDVLEPWMSWDCTHGPPNGFGLRTLYTGEWCADAWVLTHDVEATSDTREPNVHVVRGGGAYFWPWQDEEWIWCMSAARSPSSEMPEQEWSFRIVLPY